MRITPLVLAGALVVAAGAAGSPASAAASKKPISKTYAVTAPVPDPTNWAGQGGVAGYSVCAQRVPSSFQADTFKAPAAGKLKVTLSGFNGDWDLLIMDSKKSEVTAGGDSAVATPAAPATETATAKIKKAGTYTIVACNWAGGPTGSVSYTFTYA
jgi:hypothetical protein